MIESRLPILPCGIVARRSRPGFRLIAGAAPSRSGRETPVVAGDCPKAGRFSRQFPGRPTFSAGNGRIAAEGAGKGGKGREGVETFHTRSNPGTTGG